ncbi:putative Diguanylate cyclase [Magnetospirillum sp. LM-5]|uniref:sensor domain-containing diguanylate cyclase n=1 Tax=Magnetospirillum sp. LM-5 TaxID=2681466 RepID=UPI0013822D43|nr:sensor domain-containing diguanylate cyclase [Magnetospirillum sp. LM-5]CAA7621454.1 putative Diguanylate cyclase [Magnetospirillum sp. LM-5]
MNRPTLHRFYGWVLLGALTAAILAVFSFLAWKDFDGRITAAARQGHDTTWFLARSVSERFRQFDRELSDLVGRIEAAGPASMKSPDVWERMIHTTQSVEHLRTIGLVDHSGRVVSHTDYRDQLPSIKVADRAYFKFFAEGGVQRSLFISPPFVTRVSSETALALVRGIYRPNGAFAGLVVMTISPDAFDLLGGMPNLPSGSAIAIHRRDGINLFRVPPLPGQLGQDLSRTALFTQSLPQAPFGVAWTRPEGSVVDGTERLLAYRSLDEWPLVVVVGVLRREIVAGWRADWMRNALLVGIALVGFSWLAVVVQRQITSRLEVELALTQMEIGHRLKIEEELRVWATTDSLTGIANRRHFLDIADREIQRTRRYGRPLSVLIMDADHFKSINDGYGHAVGDEALKAIARVAATCLRDADLLGRLGGEEFGVLLPETDLAGARELAERLRAAVAEIDLTVAGGSVRPTISIGGADLSAEGEGIDSVLARADQALYRAKERGRNCVELVALAAV